MIKGMDDLSDEIKTSIEEKYKRFNDAAREARDSAKKAAVKNYRSADMIKIK